jgi:hypothetical protein
MQHGVLGSLLFHNSIRIPGSAPSSKPTTFPSIIQLYNQEKTPRANKRRCLILKVWWRKHLRLPIRDWERGWINYLTIDSKPNLNSCSFCVLRPAEWRQTVNLWIQTPFAILKADVRRNKRKMWGFASWEIFGQVQGTGFEIQIYLQFPVMNRFWNLDFSAVCHNF